LSAILQFWFMTVSHDLESTLSWCDQFLNGNVSMVMVSTKKASVKSVQNP